MHEPGTPPDEAQRIAALRELGILDTRPEERFDRLTRLARRLFDVPIALVSLVDTNRQWFKSRAGLDATETGRDISFCGHAILGDRLFEITDAREDERFRDNPLVTGDPGIRFYAGCPLHAPDGHRVGTLCLIDGSPRALEPDQRELLEDLGTMAEREFAAGESATMDATTGLSNRSGFIALARQAFTVCDRTGRPGCLLVFEVAGACGTAARGGRRGAAPLAARFAGMLRECIPEADVIGRLGIDTFAAMISGPGAECVEETLERLCDATKRDASTGGVALSFGVTTIPFDRQRHVSLRALLAEGEGGVRVSPCTDGTLDEAA